MITIQQLEHRLRAGELRIEADVVERRELTQRLEFLRHDDPERQEVADRLTALVRATGPHRERRQRAQEGIGIVAATIDRYFPDARVDQISEQHVQQFAARHRNLEKGAA